MIIVLKPEAKKADAEEILERIEALGCKPLYMPGSERVVLGALGDERVLAQLRLDGHPLVERIQPVLSSYKMVSREFHPDDTIVDVGGVAIGGQRFVVIAGPCSVESAEQMDASARAVTAGGGTILRGGAFKPRTSPYAFQGMGQAGLDILSDVAQRYRVPAVTEVVTPADVERVAASADALQIGARNMQNYRLLTAVGQTDKPVLLKRGMSAQLDELLLAAEYIVAEGNPRVILCERGIRTFSQATRNTLDLNAVPYLKQRCHLPVVVDPSHGTGARELVAPMSYAAVACGADGLIIEVHHNPSEALSDGKQSLFPDQFAALMQMLRKFVEAAGREL